MTAFKASTAGTSGDDGPKAKKCFASAIIGANRMPSFNGSVTQILHSLSISQVDSEGHMNIRERARARVAWNMLVPLCTGLADQI